MASLLYLDNSNFYLTACLQLQSRNPQHFRPPHVRYDNLLNLLALGEPVKKATIYTSTLGGSPKDGYRSWNFARQAGWDVEIRKRSSHGQEKLIDTEIATDLIIDGLGSDSERDQLILIAGDSDYLPAVRKLKAQGIPVYVAFWDFCINDELRREAAVFFNLSTQLPDLLTQSRIIGPNERAWNHRRRTFSKSRAA